MPYTTNLNSKHKQGDFIVDDKFTFEIGGSKKRFEQKKICQTPI